MNAKQTVASHKTIAVRCRCRRRKHLEVQLDLLSKDAQGFEALKYYLTNFQRFVVVVTGRDYGCNGEEVDELKRGCCRRKRTNGRWLETNALIE